ncbi:MAG TPA: AI-2E family transporter [Alphaproteobacteria bacterium]
MSPARQVLFWTAIAVAFVVVLVVFGDVLLPFVAGMAIAYFLDPVADRLEAAGLSRTVATTLVLALFFVAFVTVLLLLVPLLQGQLVELVRQLPAVFDSISAGVTGLIERATSSFDEAQVGEAKRALADLKTQLVTWLLNLIGGVWASGVALVNLIGLLVITPVVAWYLLRDWDALVARIDRWLPRDHAEVIRAQVRLIDRALAGFVRGQATVCVILGAGYALALELAGLRYGLAIGLVAGVISFIPYVGSLTGLLLGLGLGYAQFGLSLHLAAIAAIFFAGQLIEGNYLTPKLVGGRVGLHAVWVIFALLAGGSLLGFVGILLAVPVAAVIGVLTRFALGRYLDSRLYRGTGAGA